MSFLNFLGHVGPETLTVIAYLAVPLVFVIIFFALLNQKVYERLIKLTEALIKLIEALRRKQ